MRRTRGAMATAPVFAVAPALILMFAACLTPIPRPAAADPRLEERFDARTAREISQIVDSARATGLPTEPLVSKALEGASKGARASRIVAVVRAHAAALGAARSALGPGSGGDEIVAGAGALMAGVARDTLERLRAARPGQSLVIPLVVLADLVTRRVPVDAASSTVISAFRAGVRDRELLRLRERVEQDILSGAPPATAVAVRGRALLLNSDPRSGRRPSSRRSGLDPGAP